MTIEVLRGRAWDRIRGRPRTEPEPLAIGEHESSDVAGCPACARPIARDATRCPGCGTRLLVGIPLQRAGLFLIGGAAAGLVLGGLVVGMVLTRTGPLPVSSTDSGSASATTVGPPAIGAMTLSRIDGPVQGGTTSGITPESSSALRLAAVVNARLAGSVAVLQGQLRVRRIATSDIAATLRAIDAEAAYGIDVTSGFGTWATGDGLRGRLANLYDRFRATARQGLAASLTNDAAYRAVARAITALLPDLRTVRQATVDLAKASGITLPAEATAPTAP